MILTRSPKRRLGRKGIQLRQGTGRAAFASGGVEMLGRGLSVVLAVAIARTLQPGEVGVLGLASIVVSLLSVVGSCAETAGVTSRLKGTDVAYALVAVAIHGVLVTILAAITLAALPAISWLLASREGAEVNLATLVKLLLLQLGLELGATFPRVMLQRRLRLTRLAMVNLSQVAGHVGTALLLLSRGYGSTGVVIASLLGVALGAGVAWLQLARDGRMVEDRSDQNGTLRQVVIVTVRLIAARGIGYLNGRLDNLIVAGVLGPTAMGFYGMAWALARQPISLLSQTLDSVLIPTLAHIQADSTRVRRILFEAVEHYYLLLVLGAAGLFVLGPSLVSIILGEKWMPLIPCLRLMTITILVAPIVTSCHSLLIAKGRADIVAIAAGAQLIAVLIVMGPLSKHWGIVGAAAGDAVVMAVLTATLWMASSWYVVPRLSAGVLRSICAPALAAIVGGATAWTVGTGIEYVWLRLVCQASVMVVVYVAFLWWIVGRESIRNVLRTLCETVRGAEGGPETGGRAAT